jgi:hypothetical protein
MLKLLAVICSYLCFASARHLPTYLAAGRLNHLFQPAHHVAISHYPLMDWATGQGGGGGEVIPLHHQESLTQYSPLRQVVYTVHCTVNKSTFLKLHCFAVV